MIKIYSIVILTLSVITSYAQSFIENELVTLSKGACEELYDKDSIVQIGSALYNVNTNEIIVIKFVEDALDEGVEEELLGRFLSVDPLTSGFSFYTPYQYAGNKPIAAIDLDGLEEYVVVRWFDNTGKYVGGEVFKVTNANDRVLGQKGVLYLNLTKDPSGNSNDDNFFRSSKRASTAAGVGGSPFTNAMKDRGFIDEDNKLTEGVPEIVALTGVDENGKSMARNDVDRMAIKELERVLKRKGDDNDQGVATTGILTPQEVIYFDKASSVIKANQSGKVGDIVNFLNANPDYSASVTGGASQEWSSSKTAAANTTNNTTLSNSRASSVTKAINKAVSGSDRVDNTGSNFQLRQNSSVNPNERKATIDTGVIKPETVPGA